MHEFFGHFFSRAHGTAEMNSRSSAGFLSNYFHSHEKSTSLMETIDRNNPEKPFLHVSSPTGKIEDVDRLAISLYDSIKRDPVHHFCLSKKPDTAVLRCQDRFSLF
jgi:hypothetical protein